MTYRYPVDVADLVARAKSRGEEFIRRSGLRDGMREDEQLRAITDWVSPAWFPVTLDRRPHDEVSIGLPKLKRGGGDYCGRPVLAAADGEVICIQQPGPSAEGFDRGRIIFRHKTPDGHDFYLQYRYLKELAVQPRDFVEVGQKVGAVGWHGNFPHVGVSVASLSRIGDDRSLGPSCRSTAIPIGEAAWGIHCMRTDHLDPEDWPIKGLASAPGFLYDAIEFIRFCRDLDYRHFVGPGSPHQVVPVLTPFSFNIQRSGKQDVVVPSLLSYPALRDDPQLQALAHDPTFAPIERAGQLSAPAVMALQDALHACKLSPGRIGPNADKPGVDGEFGDATERALAEFQNGLLKQHVEKATAPSLLAGMAGKLRTDGKLDWLTLIGLDACASPLASTPPAVPKVEPAAPPPERPVDPKPAVVPGSDGKYGNTFDASKPGELSVHFGIRMYKALLGPKGGPTWIWNGEWNAEEAAKQGNAYRGKALAGVGYSTCNGLEHYTVFDASKLEAKRKEREKAEKEKPTEDADKPKKKTKAELRAEARKEQAEEVKLQAQEELANGERLIDVALQSEWPDVGIDALRLKVNGKDATVTVGNATYPKYNAWHVNWVGNNYTNCCNSQLAALACALATGKDGAKFTIVGGKEFGIERTGPEEYLIQGDSKTIQSKYMNWNKNKVVEEAVSRMLIFEGTFVAANATYKTDPDGSGKYEHAVFDEDVPGAISAIREFGMGEAVFSRKVEEQNDANYRKMLVGDQGATSGHAWMVGDVRYGIWIEGGRKFANQDAPDFAVDQSSFVGEQGPEGWPFPVPKGTSLLAAQTMAGLGPEGRVTRDLVPPLTHDDCDWLADVTNEAEFRNRIARLLEKEPAAAAGGAPARPAGTITVGGRELRVARIAVLGIRIFSANIGGIGKSGAVKQVAYSMYYQVERAPKAKKGEVKKPDIWTRDDAVTKDSFARCGITSAWRGLIPAPNNKKTVIAIGRFYKPQ